MTRQDALLIVQVSIKFSLKTAQILHRWLTQPPQAEVTDEDWQKFWDTASSAKTEDEYYQEALARLKASGWTPPPGPQMEAPPSPPASIV